MLTAPAIHHSLPSFALISARKMTSLDSIFKLPDPLAASWVLLILLPPCLAIALAVAYVSPWTQLLWGDPLVSAIALWAL